MKQGSSGSLLSTVFVDYDNIYLSLKRKNEAAAKKFAKDSATWMSAIESGELLTTTNGQPLETKRRLVMSRCYGNPVPRRNNHDNATDMNSFPFVRHNFLRSGFEVIDCPPLTAQLKNSADIRMVMDIRDFLTHDTYFDEFIILSGDADFTPLLHRLRAHARRTVIYANDYTAAPYTAICDGELREADLIRLLVEGKLPGEKNTETDSANTSSLAQIAGIRREIIAEVTNTARAAGQPIPLESLADRAVRSLGHEKTVGSGWGGAGSFRELLATHLTGDIRLSEQPPYFVYDTTREKDGGKIQATAKKQEPMLAAPVPEEPLLQQLPATNPQDMAMSGAMSGNQASNTTGMPQQAQPAASMTNMQPPMASQQPAQQGQALGQAMQTGLMMPNADAGMPEQMATTQTQANYGQPTAEPTMQPQMQSAPQQASMPPAQTPTQPMVQAPGNSAQMPASANLPTPTADPQPSAATEIQRSIARIHEACQAPPLSPPEYRVLFDAISQEISANGLAGAQTLENISVRMNESGIETRADDIRFVIDVISESDPWFEQGKTANLFASRFRNFVIARCRSQGLNLTAGEIDLIDAWFLAPIAKQNQQQQMQPETQQYQEPMRAAAGGGSAGPIATDTMMQQPQMSQQAVSPSANPASQAGMQSPSSMQQPMQPQMQQPQTTADQSQGGRWWGTGGTTDVMQQPQQTTPMGTADQPTTMPTDPYTDRFADNRADMDSDEFPRIVRGRLRN